jgi:hypothetical protein
MVIEILIYKGSVVWEDMINLGKEGSFVSSLSETWRANNNNVLRSGFGLISLEEALRDEDMLGKHESEYLVTLHMVLTD